MKLLILFVASITLANTSSVAYLSFLPKFAFEVYQKNINENVIVSPASLYTALGLAYLGANGNTATEMQNILQFGNKTKEEVAKYYAEFLKNFETYGSSMDDKETEFKFANRLYVDQKYELDARFNELVSNYLQSSAEKVNFADPILTADKINNWVSESTKQKIQNIISSQNIMPNMSVILVNAVYFRAHWKHSFLIENTKKRDFFMNQNQNVPVDIMFQEDYFDYAEWEDLDATAIQIPFVNTDMFMLVILPKDIDGLETVQKKLETLNFNALRREFTVHKVKLSLPRCKFEYSISLEAILMKMGLNSMFTNANFSSLIASDKSVPFSKVIHKAFIEVDEYGTDASAATLISTKKSIRYYVEDPEVYEFNADHPFMFAIKNRDTIYFAGQVNKF